MGRKKIEIRKIANDKKRSTTMVKRKAGLIKKAMELSILCDCDIAVLILDSNGDMTQYASSNAEALYTKFAANPHQVRTLNNADYHDFEQKEDDKSQSQKSTTSTVPSTPATPQPTVKAPIPPYRAGQPVYSYFVAPGSNFAFLAPHPLTGTTPLQSLNNVNVNNAPMSAVSGTQPQIYAVPLGAVPGLTAVSAGSAAAPNTVNTSTITNSVHSTSVNNTTMNTNSAVNMNTSNNNTMSAANNTTAVSESAAMTGVNMSPDTNPLTTSQTPPLISLSAGASPVLSPGSVKYSPKEFLPFTEEDTHTGLTPPLMLASPTSIGSAASPLSMDHVFALPKSKKRKIDEISSPNEDPTRPFSPEDGTGMTSHVIPLSTNHVTKQQQQDDAIMTTLSSALGASQGTGSALTPVFALTAVVSSDHEDEAHNSSTQHNTTSAVNSASASDSTPLTSSGPKKKDLKITIPSHGLFVAPYPVMLAPHAHESADSTDTSKSGNTSALPTAGPATPGVFMPPMTPHLVTPLGANFEFPQFFLPQSPFVQSPLMTPTFAPFYSFMPSTPKI